MLNRETVSTIIGKGFADRLDGEVFTANTSWFYTRREMVEQLGCANFIAAARLAKVLKRLGIKNPKDLYHLDPFSLARAKGIGEASIFVAMCILDASGHDVMKWWKYNDNELKFSSFRTHAITRAKRRSQEV